MSADIDSVIAERLPGTVRTPLETIDEGLKSENPEVRQLAKIADEMLAFIGTNTKLDWN